MKREGEKGPVRTNASHGEQFTPLLRVLRLLLGRQPLLGHQPPQGQLLLLQVRQLPQGLPLLLRKEARHPHSYHSRYPRMGSRSNPLAANSLWKQSPPACRGRSR